jgi:hypothetical protein
MTPDEHAQIIREALPDDTATAINILAAHFAACIVAKTELDDEAAIEVILAHLAQMRSFAAAAALGSLGPAGKLQ